MTAPDRVVGVRDPGAAIGAAAPLIELRRPQQPEHWTKMLALIDAYAASLSVDLCFQDFARERETLAQRYAPPEGDACLAMDAQGQALGCVALRRLSSGDVEMKRLYVRPQARGSHLGERLVHWVLERASAMGAPRVVLDTLPEMGTAQGLYARMGFTDIAPYTSNPVPGARFMGCVLPTGSAGPGVSEHPAGPPP